MISEARFTAQDIPSKTMEPTTTTKTRQQQQQQKKKKKKRKKKKKKRRKAFLDNATHCLNFAKRIGNQWGWILLLTTATMEVFKEPILQ